MEAGARTSFVVFFLQIESTRSMASSGGYQVLGKAQEGLIKELEERLQKQMEVPVVRRRKASRIEIEI